MTKWARSLVLYLIASLALPAQGQDRIQNLQNAAVLIDRNDFAAAEAELELLLKEQPDDAVALNLLGVIRMRQKNFPEAENLFKRAIGTGRPLLGPHMNLAVLYGSARPLDALSELEECLIIAPDNQRAKTLIRSIAKEAALQDMRAGEKDKAIAIMLKARAAMPDDPEVLYELGLVSLDSGFYADAQKCFERVLQIRPGNNEARYGLARAYLNENLAEQAEHAMRQYLTAKPDDASAQYGLGYILVAEQKLDEARAAFEKSLALQPGQTESLFQLGEIDVEQGQTGRARDRFAQVLARDPHHAGALTEIGIMAFRASDYSKAKNDLEQAVAAAPSYQKAHYFYALTLAKMGDKEQANREFDISAQLQKKHITNVRLDLPQQ
ncbi:MAG: tetratricopeptide repeat protein [Acidobacteriaceae bacterium]|nr:tetratricopeptide repeat protein [Acidobacteriaceae bacterium]